jgi:hypothetical protein
MVAPFDSSQLQQMNIDGCGTLAIRHNLLNLKRRSGF